MAAQAVRASIAEAPAGAEAVEADRAFKPVEELTKYAVNALDIKKLREAGFYTVRSLLQVPVKKLHDIKGISEAKVEKLLEAARKVDAITTFYSGTAMLTKRKEVVHITTGSSSLDAILGGGVESKSITEIHGEYRTGKTQLMHTLAVTSQLPAEQGGGEGKVIYIDSEGTFRPERIIEIAGRFNLDGPSVLDNILVARALTHEAQLELLDSAAAAIVEDEAPFRLLILDSIMSNFRAEFQGRGELADRQQKLLAMLARLQRMAEEFNLAVVLTNHVISDPGGGAMFVSDPKKAAGGHVMAHYVTTRLMCRKGKGEERVAKIIDSPLMAEAEATYVLTAGGVANAKD